MFFAVIAIVRVLARYLKIIVVLCCVKFAACSANSGYNDLDPPRRTPVYYVTKKGDSVNSLAQRFKVSPASIILLNDIENPKSLPAGYKLHVGYRVHKGSGGEVQLTKASLNNPKAVPVPKDVGPKNQSGRLGWPVLKGTVVSSFGPRGDSFHDGIDIACPIGTPVYAGHGGRVIYADGGLGGYGKLVIIRHKSGFTTVYAHNNRLRVSEGDEIKKGDRIADSGNTGHSTGPHLHFEVRVKDGNGRYVAVDPLPLLLADETKNPNYRINDNLTPLLVKR